MRRVAATVLSLLTGPTLSCGGLLDVERQGLRPLAPLPVYAQWWAEVEACSARRGDVRRVRWQQADVIRVNRQIVLGQWEAPHVITVNAFHVENPDVVRHEMLHDLLTGDPGHRDSAWMDCALGDRVSRRDADGLDDPTVKWS